MRYTENNHKYLTFLVHKGYFIYTQKKFSTINALKLFFM